MLNHIERELLNEFLDNLRETQPERYRMLVTAAKEVTQIQREVNQDKNNKQQIPLRFI